jgi:hypothetical protein
MYLIEDPEVLSDLLKHYDRYIDFRLFTDQAQTYSARLGDIYRTHATLRMKLDPKHADQLFQYSASDVATKLRGNHEWENLLQEKTWMDWWIVERSKEATVRLQKVIASLRHED